MLCDRKLQNAPLIAIAMILAGPVTLLAAEKAASDPAQGELAIAAKEIPNNLVSLAIGPQKNRSLRGRDARCQLVVTATDAAGGLHDVTHFATYVSDPEGIVEIAADGFLTPAGDGTATIIATYKSPDSAGEVSAEFQLEVSDFDRAVPTNFPNQIVPIFTKHGCNGGGCHGKSGGQNGFRLSLLGFYPEEDYEFLAQEARGRRISPLNPDQSLLLLKAANIVPHGGGERIVPDSYEYRMIHRWMRQGIPYGNESDPTVSSIDVYPTERTMGRRSLQQISVIANYTDGSVEDVTRMAQFESNDTEMAEVTENGGVQTLGLPGSVAVMVRFQAKVGVYRGHVPLGAEVTLPQPRNFVDELVFDKLETLGIPPADICNDATFLRRVTIDIAGRLPTAAEAREFLASDDLNKRDKVIERLLASPDYADHFANKWSAVLRNKKKNAGYTRGTYAFHDWVRTSLLTNKPYDRFVEDIIAAAGDVNQHPPVTWYRQVATQEQQVEDVAQLFLGLRIQCARCHHHPFEKWSQKDYYSFSAFFSRVGKKQGRDGLSPNDEPRIFHSRGVASAKNPRSGETVKPTGLGSGPMDIPVSRDPRKVLAEWMRAPENPFFARALVNRYWKHFFGRGFVEPEDDLRVTNPASHPQLLTRLSKHFIETGFDLKELVRTIARSKTYQFSSMPNEHNERDKQNFSRYYPQRLTAEILYDALHQVTDAKSSFGGLPAGTRAVQLPDAGFDNYFLKVFGKPKGDSSCECERSQDASLAQSLHLLNSKEIHTMLTADTGRAARMAKAEPSHSEKVSDLYYSVYARPPVEDELKVAIGHIEKTEDKKQAYEDIVWALVNTKEFLFNH